MLEEHKTEKNVTKRNYYVLTCVADDAGGVASRTEGRRLTAVKKTSLCAVTVPVYRINISRTNTKESTMQVIGLVPASQVRVLRHHGNKQTVYHNWKCTVIMLREKVCWGAAQCPRNMLVYLRDRSAETIVNAVILRSYRSNLLAHPVIIHWH